MRDAYIISGLRSPIGKAKKGSFRFTRSDDLAAQVIQKLIKKTKGLDPNQVDDLIVETRCQRLNKECRWLDIFFVITSKRSSWFHS